MAVDAFPKSPASGARSFCKHQCSRRRYKGVFSSLYSTVEKLANANSATPHPKRRWASTVSSATRGLLDTKEEQNVLSIGCSWMVWLGPVPISPSGTKFGNWHQACIRPLRAAPGAGRGVACHTAPASWPLRTEKCRLSDHCSLFHLWCRFCSGLYGTAGAELPTQAHGWLIQSLPGTFGSLRPIFTGLLSFLLMVAPIRPRNGLSSAGGFWGTAWRYSTWGWLEPGEGLCWWLGGAEGDKEQAGGLLVGGNLFFQHSCLQRACLFTP